MVASTSPAVLGVSYGTSAVSARAEQLPEGAKVEGGEDEAPVRELNPVELRNVGEKLTTLFEQYRSDRRILELRWLRNERQYLGIYDPEIEKELSVNRSKAYPRLTRIKCISVLSRLMNLMFPGNERNWEIHASPDPDMTPEDVKEAIENAQKKDQEKGIQTKVDLPYAMAAMQTWAEDHAETLTTLIDDQLQELGGDQTYDFIALNREVLRQGIIYGPGLLRGPFARETKSTKWVMDPTSKTPKAQKTTVYKPVFEFLRCWDFYPDLSAKTFAEMDGYFTRHVMSRAQLKKLSRRTDFMTKQIGSYLSAHQMGNYRPQPFETELRAMGVKVNVNEMKTETSKYEVIVWHGQLSGAFLQMCGVKVDQDKLSDDMDAEVWTIEGNVIKCMLNPWAELDVDVKTLHTFLFDEDDTSPVGFGLPNAVRDSQMAVSASTRMLLDNASVVCGPNLELNTDLLRADQDLTSTSAYKFWYREGTGADAQFPAVRPVTVDAHLTDLQAIIELFMKFADLETFVGPATGGDMSQGPSEPMRTAAGASMLRGDAALPFKDIVRHFDKFTQSVIYSLVQFNRKFNPELAPDGDYDVIARGATSLIAKEVRGMQIDQLAASLDDLEKPHIDMRKFTKARFAARDLTDLLVSEDEADRNIAAQSQAAQQQTETTLREMESNIRKNLADAFKSLTQGQKNAAAADAQAIEAAFKVLETGANNAIAGQEGGAGPDQDAGGQPDAAGAGGSPPAGGAPAGGGQGQAGGMPGG